jgi:hypothetical protein
MNYVELISQKAKHWIFYGLKSHHDFNLLILLNFYFVCRVRMANKELKAKVVKTENR